MPLHQDVAVVQDGHDRFLIVETDDGLYWTGDGFDDDVWTARTFSTREVGESFLEMARNDLP